MQDRQACSRTAFAPGYGDRHDGHETQRCLVAAMCGGEAAIRWHDVPLVRIRPAATQSTEPTPPRRHHHEPERPPRTPPDHDKTQYTPDTRHA